jgi:hypothetical protein
MKNFPGNKLIINLSSRYSDAETSDLLANPFIYEEKKISTNAAARWVTRTKSIYRRKLTSISTNAHACNQSPLRISYPFPGEAKMSMRMLA